MKKNKLILTLIFILSVFFIDAQYKMDFGVKFGGTNYLGEIGGKEKSRRNFIWDMKLDQTNISAGGFLRYRFNSYFGLNFSLNYGKISGDDQFSSNPGRNWRNLRFRNTIVDFAMRAEGYFFEVNDVGHTGRYAVDFKGYGFAGLSVFHHNPQGAFKDGTDWYNLQPLQTEGQHYSLWQVGIPLGFGIAFTYKREHRFGWDVSWTTTFTDYLDDISTVYATHEPGSVSGLLANQSALVTPEEQMGNFVPGSKRGDPSHNDAYLYTQFYYSYVMRGRSGFYKSSYGWVGGRSRNVRKVRAKF